MAKEIERKFLILHDGWKSSSPSKGTHIVQGYIAADDDQQVRVRIEGNKAYITLKKTGGQESVRDEFEYAIPVSDAKDILSTFRNEQIEKTRYEVEGPDNKVWEVDVYAGTLKGLTVAELELGSAQETFDKPHWVGKDITGDKRFANRNLARSDTIPDLSELKTG